jgi:tRNA A-37 threonylcarbamoyl transferase component Bud32
MPARPPAPTPDEAPGFARTVPFVLNDAIDVLPPTIGKYRVLARLGEGATAEVFLARDDFRKQQVAIKRLRVGLPADSVEGQFGGHFFAAEAALVGKLQHPNVVQLLDAVSEGPAPYLVMEYVPGDTLKRHCRPDHLLSLETIVEVAFKCAMALGYCWRHGLIHRDVKPANILTVPHRGEIVDVKISDFGSVLNLTSDRTQVFRVGSLTYMSPEQVEGADLDCRCDIYSLGAVMYHLIAGRPPFEAASQPALLHQLFHGTLTPLTQLREGVTPALDALVRRALARDREARFANWDAFAQALSALVANRDVPRRGDQAVLDSERFSLLRSLEFFVGFGDVELWEVVHRAHWARYAYGDALFRKGQQGNRFHIIAQGKVEVYRNGQRVAKMGAGTSVGEMAYLAPNPELRTHSADVLVSAPATTVSFTPESLLQLSLGTRSQFDAAFIRVLVRRLHAAQEALIERRLADKLGPKATG